MGKFQMRELLLIRHAIAEDRDMAKPGLKDEDRALTKSGCAKMAKITKGLKVTAPNIELIASSPLLRAVQTAEIIHREYREARLITTDVLRPGLDLRNFIRWAQQLPDTGLIALVGHEPDLSFLICRLLTGNDQTFLHFKKGGASMVEVADSIKSGEAQLKWFLTPGQLRRIGEER
jgi:phosphohistidine phosphatase